MLQKQAFHWLGPKWWAGLNTRPAFVISLFWRTIGPIHFNRIATGMLLTAIHHAGLVLLTHTPSPIKFLNKILDRPANKRPFLLLVGAIMLPGPRFPI